MKLIRYLFPPRRLQQNLPLLPLDWTSNTGIDPSLLDLHLIQLAQGYSVARTPHDTQRFFSKQPGKPSAKAIQAGRRKRRTGGTLRKAFRRLKKILY